MVKDVLTAKLFFNDGTTLDLDENTYICGLTHQPFQFSNNGNLSEKQLNAEKRFKRYFPEEVAISDEIPSVLETAEYSKIGMMQWTYHVLHNFEFIFFKYHPEKIYSTNAVSRVEFGTKTISN
ncbi:MAG: hypothetical protein ABF750_04060 [Oenococcus oeni]